MAFGVCVRMVITMSYTELQYKHVKGLKQYRCGWCAELIEKGERQVYRTYVFCGDFCTDRMHLECEEAMKKTPHDDLVDGWAPGDFKRGDKNELLKQIPS